MQIVYYNNKSDRRCARKTLQQIGLQGATLAPFEPLGDISGRVICAYDASNAEANYVKLDGVPYFVTDCERDTGGRMVLTLQKDVLCAYLASLLECPAVLANAETAMNSYAAGAIPTAQYMQQQTRTFGGFSFVYPAYYVLVCVG